MRSRIALVASLLLLGLVSPIGAPEREGGRLVVIATALIPAGEAITAESLREEWLPWDAIYPGAYASIAEVEGRIAAQDIRPREEVLAPRTSDPPPPEHPESLLTRIAESLAEEKNAPPERVEIRLDEAYGSSSSLSSYVELPVVMDAATARLLVPGLFVDAVTQAGADTGIDGGIPVVQNARVVSVEPQDDGRSIVVLRLRRMDAHLLAKAGETGTLRFVLSDADGNNVWRPTNMQPQRPRKN